MPAVEALVVQPPLRVSRDFIDYPYHCDLSVVQAAAVLRAAGHGVRVLDAFALAGSGLAPLDDGYVRLGSTVGAVLERLGDPDVVVVAYSAFHRPPARDPVLAELLAGIRAALPGRPVLLADLYQSGQHYVEAAGERVLESYPEVDAWLKYEAENHLAALVDRLLEARPASPEVVVGGEVDDLDALPLPAWDMVDLEARDAFLSRVVEGLGRGAWAFPVDGRSLPMISSRGCPYRCAHCSSNPGRQGKKKTQRRHDPGYLAHAVETLATRHGATRVDVLDEMVNVEPAHFEALLDALCERDLRFDFPNGMRADWVEPSHLDAMAGRVATLSVSAESGDQRVVDRVVEKALDLAAVERTLDGAKARGIPTLVHFIIGMPGETRAEIARTLDYALSLHERYGAFPGVQYATPLPGTRLAERTRDAARAPLPVVEDYGPLFQHRPVTSSDAFTAADLETFKHAFDARIARSVAPATLALNLTFRCNNRCPFCAVDTKARSDLKVARAQRILEEHARRGVLAVELGGGEPTLHEGLITVVATAKRLGYRRVHLVTNGRRLAYESYARRLVRAGLTSLAFSVHGHDTKTHDQNVGVEGAFAQTLLGIEHAVRHRPLGLSLSLKVAVTKSNVAHLEDVAGLAYTLGLRALDLQVLTPFGRGTVFVSPETKVAAAAAMRLVDAWHPRLRIRILNLPFCFAPGYEPHLVPDAGGRDPSRILLDERDAHLEGYLASTRSYTDACEGCPHRLACGGFYETRSPPDPPWRTGDEGGTASPVWTFHNEA